MESLKVQVSSTGTQETESKKVQVSFTGIQFSVKVKGVPKQILHDVSAHVKGGEMLCIIGPSGSGKTSLLQIISHRISSNGKHVVSGSVLCNGQKLASTQFQRIAGLVTQEDVFNPMLTVQETLAFGACFRLPAKSRSSRVEEVIALLGLEGCAQTRVGDDSNPYLKGISGGEKRRLAIAAEILDPKISVLVLDEPTSGLDAAAALNVARLLHGLGMTVIATLHQPRASIMMHFHQLLALAQGRSVFYGPLASYEPYLIDDLKCEIPRHESPYDFLLDALNPAMGKELLAAIGALENDCTNMSEGLAELYGQSQLYFNTMESVVLDESATVTDDCLKKRNNNGPAAGWGTQFMTILIRTALIKTRDPTATMTQISTAIGVGIIIGAIYWDVYNREHFAVTDALMAVTMSIINAAFLPFDSVLTFPMERKTFLRDRRAGLYSSSSFFLGRILADVPLLMIAAASQAVIIYFMVGLQMGFFPWLLANIGAILAGAALLQMCGALCRNFEEANILVMLLVILSMMVSDAFTREVPAWLGWAREISIVALLCDLVAYMEFRDVVAAEFQVRVVTDGDAMDTIFKLLAIVLVWRFVTFVAVKFLHTGRTLRENIFD